MYIDNGGEMNREQRRAAAKQAKKNGLSGEER